MPALTPGKGMHISRVAKARRGFICSNLPIETAVTIEFGALDNPTFLKSEGDVFFADFFTQKESRDRHSAAASSNHTVDLIVQVDFVLRTQPVSRQTDRKFDLVMANHVIEHLPDPIGWLEEVRSIVDAGSFLFLSVPDRRYTFDYFKGCSDAVDWIEWSEAGADKANKYQVLRHLYYHADHDGARAWRGEFPEDHLHRIGLRDAIRRAEILSREYSDVHCSVFTCDSFKRLFADLASAGLVDWTIQAIADVASGDNEFRVILKAL